MDAKIRHLTNNNFVKCLHLNAHNSVIFYRQPTKSGILGRATTAPPR